MNNTLDKEGITPKKRAKVARGDSIVDDMGLFSDTVSKKIASMQQRIRLLVAEGNADVVMIRQALYMTNLMGVLKDHPKLPEEFVKRMRKLKFKV